MMRKGTEAWVIARVLAPVIAVIVVLSLRQPVPAMGQPSAAATAIAIDARPGGNGPRTVASVEDCVSADPGGPVDIDVVLPAPGIPSDRGIAGYQFTLVYDPGIVWVGAENTDMLLSQAGGSQIIPISDPKPNKTGEYLSVAADFGRQGIEPGGASETGPGVISRITLLPQRNGLSHLALQQVSLIDDASHEIALQPAAQVVIYVGAPCPAPTPSPSPAPANPARSSPSPSPKAATSHPTAATTAAGFGNTGGPPAAEGLRGAGWLVLAGAGVVAAGGVALLAGLWQPPTRLARINAGRDDDTADSSGPEQ